MRSISARLLTGTAVVMAIFVLLTGLSISYSVKKRAETALFDRLQGLVYGVLGATEIDEDLRLVVNDLALPDQRLNSATSGLYAEIIGNGGATVWESKSVSAVVPSVAYSPIGEWIFERIDHDGQNDVHRMQMATVWELESGEEVPFIVHVVANAEILTGQLRRFDQTLWLSLLGSAIALLLVQLWILNRSLRPLHHIGSELHEIEHGTRDKLDENVPGELKPLARSINLLLVSEKNRHQQYRHLLNDLAHSLKTPLSVLNNLNTKNTSNTSNPSDTSKPCTTQPDNLAQTTIIIDEQTSQMQKTIDRYLQRAAMQTPQYLSKPVSPLPVLTKLCDSLSKIYQDPAPAFDVNINDQFKVRLADVDLYEVLGNVLDNACKYGSSLVRITANDDDNELYIDDDGPGFPEKLGSTLLDRGARADTMVDGQGVGLAASQELMHSYGGKLQLAASPYGGARVILQFS